MVGGGDRNTEGNGMRKIAFIEGLRAWLAWTVVFGHIAIMSGVASYHGQLGWLPKAGSIAVEVFIVISGFVICNVVIERQEGWRTYMTRRAFRILPAYWVAYILALLVFPLALDLPPALNSPELAHYNTLHVWGTAMSNHPVAQALLHMLLLQGLVPDSIWLGTSEAVLGQAWSLTLEWQFYLIAPMIVMLLTNARWRLLAVMGMLIGVVLFKKGVFGTYQDPAFFPGAADIFLVGIASRIWIAELRRFEVSPVFVAGALGIGLIFKEVLWLAIWIALMAYFINCDQWREAGYTKLLRVIGWGLESPVARYFGTRSYSVYLLHTTIIELAIWSLDAVHPELTRAQLFFAVLGIAPLAIAGASDLLYRFVEHPLTIMGARIAQQQDAQPRLATG